MQEIDLQMARLINSGYAPGIKFSCELIKTCLLSDPPLCSFNAFLLSTEALGRLSDENVKSTVQAVNAGLGQKVAALVAKEAILETEDIVKVKEQIVAIYKEWIQIYGHPASNEQSQLNFVATVRTFFIRIMLLIY